MAIVHSKSICYKSLKYQKANKPSIDSILPHFLDGEMLNLALDFAGQLQSNKMKLKWASENRWKAMCAKSTICWVWYHKGLNLSPCFVTIHDYEEFIINEGWQTFILDRLNFCRPCNTKRQCVGGRDIVIFDQKLKGVCTQNIFGSIHQQTECGLTLNYKNPNETTVGQIKKLLDMEQNARDYYNRK